MSFFIILSITFVVWGDIALPPEEIKTGKPQHEETSKLTEKQTCVGVLMLSVSIFLLGQCLKRRNKLEIRAKSKTVNASL